MGVTCDTHGWKEKYIQDYVGNPEENGALGRPKRRWKNNIKMYCKVSRFKGANCIHLARKRPTAGFWDYANKTWGSK